MLYSQKIWSNLENLGENTKNLPEMSVAKITKAFKQKGFVRREFFAMNVYRDKYTQKFKEICD